MKTRSLLKLPKWLWTYSLWVTLPIALTFFVWASRAGHQYWNFGVRHDLQNGEARVLHPLMGLNWVLLKEQAKPNGWFKSEESVLAQVHLIVPEAAEAKLDHALPLSGREYVEGRLVYPDGSVIGVDLRYRGDMFWHWIYPNKSWRIKTKKQHLWNGARKWNLIVPETPALIESYISSWFPRQMGLLAPRSEMVELWVNGKRRGLYSLVEQLDEQFLRANQRMPGDLFAGELFGRDFYGFKYNNLFRFPGVWSKAAINNHYGDLHRESLETLCAALAMDPGAERGAALGKLLDMPAFGRFTAFRSLAQTAHFDPYHNWRLYYDPWRNRMEPVVWDAAAWNPAFMPGEGQETWELPAFTDFDKVLALDHRYRWETHRAFVDLFDSGLHQRALEHLSETQEQVRKVAKKDPALIHFFKRLNLDTVDTASEEMYRMMGQHLQRALARHVDAQPLVVRGELRRVATGWEVPITVRGWKPSAALRMRITGLGGSQVPSSAWRIEGSDPEAWVPAKLAVQETDLILAQPLLAGVKFVEVAHRRMDSRLRAVPRPLTYWLRISDPNIDSSKAEVSIEEMHCQDLSGREFEVPLQVDQELGAVGNESGFLFDPPKKPPVVIFGEHEFSGLTEIFSDLHIQAGSVLRMAPGASLIVHGQVIANGEEDRPISILPSEAGLETGSEPWGTFAVRTNKANGSRFRHVHMLGGSGYMDGLQEYSAMFSVHSVDDVRIEDCRFQDSFVVDDMVHVVYSKDLVFERCEFVGSLFDALDLDACDARLVDCRFVRSGNDAIDLMMSRAVIVDCEVFRSGDKGVSVGEGTHMVLLNSKIRQCQIGVEVKDGSLARLVGSKFENNPMALHAYRKNWQYGGGGHGIVQDCSVHGSETPVKAGKESSWLIVDSRKDAWDAGKRVTLVETLDDTTQWPARIKFEAAPLVSADPKLVAASKNPASGTE